MRVFWIILTLIIAGTGVVVFMPSPEANPTPALPAATQDDVIPAPAAEIQTPAKDSEEIEATPAATIESMPTDIESAASTKDDNLEELAEASDASGDVTEEASVPEFSANDIIANLDGITDTIEELPSDETESEVQTEEATESGWKLLAAQADNADEGDPITSTLSGDAGEQNPTYGSGSEVQTPDVRAPVEIALAALTITNNDDGSMTIGDTYTITGKGTRDNPYVVQWDFLVSLREFYNPREGKKAIPEHIAMFDGKYITIPGYLQFPLATPEPVECLVMLNQWDGCCIGVPPTPYDAIEVSLSEPASREQKFAVEGRIVGKLKIDPYLVGNWLIGLYLITDASVDVSGARSVEEVYGNPLPQFDPTTE